jgi:hypothetical protein
LDPVALEILQLDPIVLPDLGEDLKVELEKAENFFALIDSSV